MLNSKYKSKLQKYKLLFNDKLQTTQPNSNAKFNIIKNTYVTLHLQVGKAKSVYEGELDF